MASYTYEDYEYHSSGCKCCRLKNGNDLPIPKELSYDEISTLATKFSHSIFANWTKLNAIVKRFEPTIQKRWLKKSLKQKREILLKAWPGMSATHRPDFASFRDSHRRNTPRARTCSSAAYLWPQINLEDLQQHHLLLLFLNSRARNLPEMFIQTDIDFAHLGRGWDFPDEAEKAPTERQMMQFHNQRSPRCYGRMIEYEASTKEQVVKPLEPGLGLIGLEIQDGLYTFLHSCAKLILHDVEPRRFFLAPHVPLPSHPDAPATDEWPSLSAHMLETPYRTLQKMDIDHVKALIGSRRAASEDHLWFLWEDPGYFCDTLEEWKQHPQTTVRAGFTGCLTSPAENMVVDAVSNLLYWDFIFRKLDSMPSMDAQLKRANWDTMRLHPEDESAWTMLVSVIDIMEMLTLDHLADGVPSSPRMRHCYDWKALRNSEFDIWELRRQFTLSEFRVDMLFYALVTQDERRLHGTHKLVQEIQYMLDTDPEASQYVDSWITEHFSNLAMLSDLEWRIDGLQPWSAAWKIIDVPDNEPFENLKELYQLDRNIRTSLRDAFEGAKLFSDPLEGAFDYPVTKSYTQANVEKMRHAERELDGFWDKIEVHLMKAHHVSLKSVVTETLLEPRELHRTPEWIPPLVPQKKAAPLKDISKNTPRFYEAYSATSIETPSKPKTKIKTRGVASSPLTTDDLPSFEPEPANSREQKIPVNKRIYKTLAGLLPETGAENHQRTEVSWDELLQAMNAIGFPPEKLYGSVWMFRPKEDALVDVKRSIQFHEPKEVRRGGKIPPNMVRTFGRRLKHAYGWESGMFVCG